jgi:hypothetical protein
VENGTRDGSTTSTIAQWFHPPEHQPMPTATTMTTRMTPLVVQMTNEHTAEGEDSLVEQEPLL